MLNKVVNKREPNDLRWSISLLRFVARLLLLLL